MSEEIKAGQKWVNKLDSNRIIRIMAVSEGYCLVRIFRAFPHVIECKDVIKYYKIINNGKETNTLYL